MQNLSPHTVPVSVSPHNSHIGSNPGGDECIGDLALIKAKSYGWLIDTGVASTCFSGYSVRKACIGSILVARLAGNHAAAMVITETAAIAMEIAVGSSGLNW
jgi:hypothetical protein